MGHEFLRYTTLAMMDLLTSDMIDLRVSLSLGIAGLFLALEWMVPFRTPVNRNCTMSQQTWSFSEGIPWWSSSLSGGPAVWSTRVDSEHGAY